MEPVSLALGVLPIVGGAMKACKAIHKKLKIFRHYSRELRRVHKLVDRQSHFFTNEVHLLLRPAIDDQSVVDTMLKDMRHPKWNSKELETGMRESLGKNYDACRDIIEDIGSTMESLQALFDCFDELIARCEQASDCGEPIKDCVRRLRTRVTITYDESKFEKRIKDFREANGDLKHLREQTHALNKPSTVAVPGQKLQKRLNQEYGQFRTIREASKAFHGALTASWSRTSRSEATNGVRHTVRLFVDTQVKEDVHMNVAISCYGHGCANNNPIQERLITLQVRSKNRDWMDGLVTPPVSTKSGCSDDGPRKRRKVRFAQQEIDGCSNPNLIPGSMNEQLAVELDPCGTDLGSRDLCSVLYSSCGLRWSSSAATPCLGYIDGVSQESFRHFFYGGAVTNVETSTSMQMNHDLISMDDVLSQPAEAKISIVAQLKLARDLVSAMLKFCSTPWLREYFSLYDLSFFHMNQDLSECLKTLHLGLEFVQLPLVQLPRSTEGLQIAAAGDTSSEELHQALEHAKLQYGVRNLSLWSLGTILLQIGRWSKIEAPDDVPSIRKLSAQVPTLGPRYRDLTKKCLECDFGYGEDLSKPRLQQAVYEGVVCELSDIICSLGDD